MKNKQTPTHFEISPEDYAEYQALKAKSIEKQIDYSRIKTGSKVMLKYTGQHCNGFNDTDNTQPYDVVLFKSEHCINAHGRFYPNGEVRKSSCTFHQNGKFVLFSSDKNTDYITEVIEY